MLIDLAGAVVAWLIGAFGDAGIELVRLGSADERELKNAIRHAIETVVCRADPASRKALQRALEQCFSSASRIRVEGSSSVGDAVRAAIAGQVGQLAQWVNTDTGRPFYQDVSVSPEWVIEQVTDAFIAALRQCAASGRLAELVHGLDAADMMARLDALGLQISDLTLAAPTVATHTLPADVASFTGRSAELEQLMRALPGRASGGGLVRINVIDGKAGVGKTAFAVHAAHQLAPHFPDGQIFVRLHGHTPDQRPVEPADALAALLLAAGIVPQQIPAGLEARAGLWRDRMAGRKTLLLLDDATGSDQVRPLLPGTAGMLVLVTSRHRLTALTEALPVTLDTLEDGEAAELFTQLTGRPSLPPTDRGVGDVVRLCGHLPLAIALMAGQLKHHRTWTAADLAADLKSAADRLILMTAENESVTATFGLSYRNLPAGQQRLFRHLGLHPGTDIDAYAAAALDSTSLATARRLLDDLFSYHLIDEPARGRYRFHDLIREYARGLANEQPAERDGAAGRMLDYYLHTARDADRHLPQRTPAGAPTVAGAPPACGPDLPTRADAVTWMDTERHNLHAAVGYATRHGRPAYAIAIAAAMNSFLRTQGHWDQAVTLHHTALNAARDTSDQFAQAGALNNLGPMQRLTGDYPAATASHTRALELYRQLGSHLGEANALNDLGNVQHATGDYPAATASHARALELYRYLGDRPGEANAVNDLGAAQQATGNYPAATASHSHALKLYHDLGNRLGQAYAFNYLGVVQQATGDYPAATASHTQALKLYRELGNRLGEANTLDDLGAVQQATGQYRAAATSHTRALELYRDLGDRLGEAVARNEMGVVQRLTGDYPAAASSHARALELCRELGNRFGEANTLNNMGELSLASASPAEGHARHEQALAIATVIVSPLEDARAREGIGRCHLLDGRRGEGAAALREALAIYQRIGSPNAQRVETTLHDHGL